MRIQQSIYAFFIGLGFLGSGPAVLAYPDDIGPTRQTQVIQLTTNTMADVTNLLSQSGIDLSTAAVFFDFDETIAERIMTIEGKTYRLLGSPDRFRTYKDSFIQAYEEHNQDNPTPIDLGGKEEEQKKNDIDHVFLRKISYNYELLDGSTPALVRALQETGAFIGICSGMKATGERLNLNYSIGIPSYFHAPGSKSAGIKRALQTKSEQTFSTIVLIDNSEEYALKDYRATMAAEIADLCNIGNDLRIISIHFTKFADLATVENIRGELAEIQEDYNRARSLSAADS